MTKIMQKFTQNDITHLFAAQKYIQFVCFPFALLLSKMCVPWAVLFCTDLTDTTDILFICIRVIRVIRGAVLFCTDSTDLTESLFICIRVIRVIRTVLSVHLHPSNPCNPWADLFCTDLTDTTDIFARTRNFTDFHGVLFTCIRVIRVIRTVLSVHLHPCFSV